MERQKTLCLDFKIKKWREKSEDSFDNVNGICCGRHCMQKFETDGVSSGGVQYLPKRVDC